jgi:hypothetical protein
MDAVCDPERAAVLLQARYQVHLVRTRHDEVRPRLSACFRREGLDEEIASLLSMHPSQEEQERPFAKGRNESAESGDVAVA